jgi:thioredoxin reductase (NADPH)
MSAYDLIVIGAGPSGISAAVEARRAELPRILVLEKGPAHSQMVRTYYKPGKRVDARYAGQEAICFGLLCLKDGDRESYLGLMDAVIEQHQIPIEFNTEVWSVTPQSSGGFLVKTSQKTLETKCVLVAIGKMGKPNQPDYPIPTALRRGPQILFGINSRPIKGEKVLVVGGGDSAAEYADILSRDNTVSLSYRRLEFSKANPLNRKILEDLIAAKKIRALLGSNITAVQEHEDKARVVFAEPTFEAEVFDSILYALGGVSPVEFLRGAGAETNERGEAIVGPNYETSVPGFYVAGDLLGKENGGGSIIAGFNSAAEATRDLLKKYFAKSLEAEVVSLDHLRF